MRGLCLVPLWTMSCMHCRLGATDKKSEGDAAVTHRQEPSCVSSHCLPVSLSPLNPSPSPREGVNEVHAGRGRVMSCCPQVPAGLFRWPDWAWRHSAPCVMVADTPLGWGGEPCTCLGPAKITPLETQSLSQAWLPFPLRDP